MAASYALVPVAPPGHGNSGPAQGTAEPADSPVTASAETLVDQLVDRWEHAGAPRSVLRKAERTSPGFAVRHAPIRADRLLLHNMAWLFAFAAMFAVTVLTASLIDPPIATGELLARMAVAALLLALAGTCVTRSGQRLPLYLVCLLGLSLIYLASAPENRALQAWDFNAILLGWAILSAKSLRMWLDRLLDRQEAQLLLRAAGCR